MQQHRVCPDESTVCQASCWTKQGANNKKIPLWGYKKLEEHNSSPRKLLVNSWAHYQAQGNQSYNPQSLIKEGVVDDGDQMLHIPVCYSNYSTIQRASDTRFHQMNHVKFDGWFPFSCGHTFRSEETPDFLADINVDVAEEVLLGRSNLVRVSLPFPTRRFSLTSVLLASLHYAQPSRQLPASLPDEDALAQETYQR